MKIIKHIKVIIITCLLFAFACPVSETTTDIVSISSGIVTGAFVAFRSHYLVSKNYSTLSPTMQQSLSALAGAGVGTLVGYLLYNHLYSYTPKAKFQVATEFYSSAYVFYKHAAMLEEHFSSEDLLYDYATKNFGTDWSLGLVKKSFNKLIEELSSADVCAQQSYDTAKKLELEEPAWSARCMTLTTQCTELFKKIRMLKNIYKASVSYISGNQNFTKAANNPLLEKYFSTECELHDYAIAYFGTSWPLVIAQQNFMELKETITEARLHLEQGMRALNQISHEESAWTKGSALISSRFSDLLNDIAILEVLRKERTVALANSEKYVIQVKLYEHQQELEKQRKNAEKLAKEQREHAEKLAKKQRKHAEKEARRQREHEHELELAKFALERKKLDQNHVLPAAAD